MVERADGMRGAGAGGRDERHDEHRLRERTVVPVVQEELEVATRAVEREAVRVHQRIESRDEVLNIPVAREHVDVRRVRIDAPVDGPVAMWRDGDTLVIPVVEQVPVVRMQWVVREEVRVTRTIRHEREQRKVRLERREADVDRLDGPGSAADKRDHKEGGRP